ncbi:kelch-like protein 10 [Protopterus annectens]|uniref:kelch-like protein 10 n=1 Tax=Protopterus annectens TaxID=7888 RepID=UPI001CFAA98E|nr:kelch-like protein 10 [Protopterus annectens]
MDLIIQYAYTRTVPITIENVEQLLAAADQFHVLGLVRMCCEFLESYLCIENCIGIWKFADFYFCSELKHKAYLFILHNFEEMVKISEELLQLSAFEFGKIIEEDELNVKNEDVVFKAILKWISHDPHDRKKYIPILLLKVRLALMNADYFVENVRNNYYVKDNDECKPIIRKTLEIMYDLKLSRPLDEEFRNLLTRPRLPCTVLFAIGGCNGESPTNVIEVYDARADMWMDVTCEGEFPRMYHGAAYLNRYVYIFGGSDGVNTFNSVRRLDPLNKTWQEVAPMHSRRCYVSVTILNELIYAMGGSDGDLRLNTAEKYEPKANQWTLTSEMHERRSDANATSLHGKVYICGGFTGTDCLFTAEMYNPEANQWTLIAPMRSRRSGLGVAACGEQVYAVGGFDGNIPLRSVEAYDPINDTWRAVSSMFTPRSNFGIGVVDDFMVVAGGYDGLSTISAVEYYVEKTNKWYKAHDMGLERSAFSCCIIPSLPNIREYAVSRDSYVGFHFRSK